eukprot:g7861.t1
MRFFSALLSLGTARAGLEVAFVDVFDLTYADHGTSSLKDLSCYRANTHCGGEFDGNATGAWRRVGDFGNNGYGQPAAPLLVVRATIDDPDAVARPVAMAMNWTNKKGLSTHGSRDGGLFTPVCPAGYAALGSVAIYHEILKSTITPSNFPDLYCVRTAYTKSLAAADLTSAWTDNGSGCTYSGSVWTQPNTSMPFFAGASSSYDAPSGLATLDLSKVKVVADPAGCVAPEQVHLALGYTPATMAVQWSTQDNAAAPTSESTVQWSLDGKSWTDAMTATGEAHAFTIDSGRTWYNHVANMTGLRPATRYYYRVGGAESGWSQVFDFRSQVDADTLAASLPQHHLVFGDMGAACAFTLCDACTCDQVCDASTCAGSKNRSAGLVSELGTATHIVHTGDFAYNLADGGGTVGDQFFRNIEQIAARVPYMVSVGNHENSDNHLAHYTERFRLMPANDAATPTQTTINGKAPNNWWFSWDDGLVHYVAISTEVYFGVGPADGAARQFAWLEADLKKANANRANVPWIVVHGHRSVYC